MQDALHDSVDVLEFEDAWTEIIACYELENNWWCSFMYNNRHRWVPIYFKCNFWAEMSSTQRSEGINLFFKKYVNFNTTLKQFIEQYGLALSNKVCEEEKASFQSKHKPVQPMTTHVFEDVFQKLYTTSKFREFQKEVSDMTYNSARKVHDDETICYYDIVVKKKRFEKNVTKVFIVTMEKETIDIKCECKSFEFRGMLCSHILCVMHEEDVDFVPERYILDRWRKDLDREYLKLPMSYYKLLKNPPETSHRYEQMQELFESFIGFAMTDGEFYNEVKETLTTLKEKSNNKRRNQGLVYSTLDKIGRVYGRRKVTAPSNDEANPSQEGSTQVKDPVDKRGKGRARARRIGY